MKAMNGLFDIFGVKRPTSPFSLFTGSPKQLLSPNNADPGQHPNDVYNPINAAYNRSPLWFSSQVVGNVSPVVESSLYYPLQYNLINKDIASTSAGVNQLQFNLNSPDTHTLVLYLTATAGETVANGRVDVWLQQGDISNTVQRITLVRYCIDQNQTCPLINTAKRDATGPDIFAGIRPVYVPPGFDLAMAFVNLVGGHSATIRAVALTLPSNQPFGPLIATI